MKNMSILAIKQVGESAFELKLSINDQIIFGLISKTVAGGVWNFDSRLAASLSNSGHSAKSLLETVNKFSLGETISFPVKLVNF